MEVNIRLGGGARVRDEINLARAKGNDLPRSGKGDKKLVVMDPFLRDRNVAGGCKSSNLGRIWGVFEDLYLTLSLGVFREALHPIPNLLEATIGKGRERKWKLIQEKKHQENMAKKGVAVAVAASSSSSSPSVVAAPATVVGSLKAQQTLAIKEEVKSAVSIPVQSTVKGKATVASGAKRVPIIVPSSNGAGASNRPSASDFIPQQQPQRLQQQQQQQERRPLKLLPRTQRPLHDQANAVASTSSSATSLKAPPVVAKKKPADIYLE
ncbi:hypothetical protein BGZ65_007575 [Modicella reniformis]|uniref:Uncharacterized protein n=1 Tax=Modicella reniformis TaxID=1440133 RepID=A0A9P6SSI4_9FUNG|nr:hypothetical protein BGZ65_007575 [Modicella reniformis]